MAHADPTWAPSWPCPETTNAALPMRLRLHTFWSRTRAVRIVRYMPTRSSADSPRAVCRSWRWSTDRSSGVRVGPRSAGPGTGSLTAPGSPRSLVAARRSVSVIRWPPVPSVSARLRCQACRGDAVLGQPVGGRCRRDPRRRRSLEHQLDRATDPSDSLVGTDRIVATLLEGDVDHSAGVGDVVRDVQHTRCGDPLVVLRGFELVVG